MKITNEFSPNNKFYRDEIREISHTEESKMKSVPFLLTKQTKVDNSVEVADEHPDFQ